MYSEEVWRSFPALLIASPHFTKEFIQEDRIQYLFYTSIGKYALVKISDEGMNCKEMRDLIRKAYDYGNCSVEEYVESIAKECETYFYKLPFSQKSRTKKCLEDLVEGVDV